MKILRIIEQQAGLKPGTLDSAAILALCIVGFILISILALIFG